MFANPCSLGTMQSSDPSTAWGAFEAPSGAGDTSVSTATPPDDSTSFFSGSFLRRAALLAARRRLLSRAHGAGPCECVSSCRAHVHLLDWVYAQAPAL